MTSDEEKCNYLFGILDIDLQRNEINVLYCFDLFRFLFVHKLHLIFFNVGLLIPAVSFSDYSFLYVSNAR
jgi:hypothetical protein